MRRGRSQGEDALGGGIDLLGLIGEGDGLGGIVLQKLGADLERARAAIAARNAGG
jgi:hypothetical protein